ncbi:uncharacterized protein LOC114800934 isoform X2 [Denticeps clupeoides]|nr:uncharacterized protein LOC114800934 isoform X2 [Denticeps clupeoides]
MPSSAEHNSPLNPQLLSVAPKDTRRLLEVYVKRSLSLNDGRPATPVERRKPEKWSGLAEKNRRERKHSSDSSIHLMPDTPQFEAVVSEPFSGASMPSDVQATVKSKTKCKEPKKTILSSFAEKKKRISRHSSNVSSSSKPAVVENEIATNEPPDPTQPEGSTGKEKKSKDGSKKSKKPSLWKSFLGYFTQGGSDKDEGDSSHTKPVDPRPVEPPTPPPSCLPLPGTFSTGESGPVKPSKPLKRAFSRRKMSFRKNASEGHEKTMEKPSTLDLSNATKPYIKSVEHTNSYYEKMSDEFKKIVTEVKETPTVEEVTFLQPTVSGDIDAACLSKEEVTERIIQLIKEEGDAINSKLKYSPSISNFFQKLTYGSFQNLADHYMESEISSKPAQAAVAAPELVKLAFTLDFTARVAGLSRQAAGNVMGFGSQYLQDRFTHMSESHPQQTD